MSTEKKLTAIELLVIDLQKIQDGDLEIFSFSDVKKYLEEKYLPLEKQQIIDAQIKSLQTDFYVNYEDPEDYYNQTYKKD